MFLQTVFAFIVPWTICIMHLYKKDKMILFLFAPISSVLSSTINAFGFYFNFWEVYPYPKQKDLVILPFTLGIFSVLGSYFIYFIKKTNKPYCTLFIMTLLSTLSELIFVYFGKVVYGNGWNIYLTFFSYLLPYLLLYLYFRYLIKIKIL